MIDRPGVNSWRKHGKMGMKRFVLGDIHGNYKGLLQCFERSGFDYENDLLYSLGDLCDRQPQTREVFDELLKVKNFKMVIGNHDRWLFEAVTKKYNPKGWLFNGGTKTMESYNYGRVPDEHIKLIAKAKTLIKTACNAVIVHGGLETNKPLEDQADYITAWDRKFLEMAIEAHKENPDKRFFDVDDIYIGHTPTTAFCDTDIPQKFCNIWCLDTGSGYHQGKLTIMDMKTKEYWQSDRVAELY